MKKSIPCPDEDQVELYASTIYICVCYGAGSRKRKASTSRQTMTTLNTEDDELLQFLLVDI